MGEPVLRAAWRHGAGRPSSFWLSICPSFVGSSRYFHHIRWKKHFDDIFLSTTLHLSPYYWLLIFHDNAWYFMVFHDISWYTLLSWAITIHIIHCSHSGATRCAPKPFPDFPDPPQAPLNHQATFRSVQLGGNQRVLYHGSYKTPSFCDPKYVLNPFKSPT